MKIKPTKRYQRSFRRLTKNNKPLGIKVIQTLNLYKNDPNHPSIRLHKLSNQNIWSISVNMRIRIIFVYYKDSAILLDMGDHSISD